MRRTVKVSLRPRPRRPMTTPEKIWIRSLSPSTTLVWTRTESPTLNLAGSLRNCSDSILSSNAWFISSFSFSMLRRIARARARLAGFVQQIRATLGGASFGLVRSPLFDLRVMTGQQHFGHCHPAVYGRPRVMRILQQPVAEGLVLGALFGDH